MLPENPGNGYSELGASATAVPITGCIPLNHDQAIRKLLSEVLRKCQQAGKKRPTVAEEMSRLTGAHITASMLNDYSADSKKLVRFPACFVPAFCEVAGDERLARLLLPPRLDRKVDIASKALAISRLRRHMENLERLLEEQP